MMKHIRTEHYLLIGLVGFLLAVAVTTDYHRVVEYLFSDEAVYYMMAQSLAFDGDLEYTQQDLQRVYAEGWYAGPQGIYLTKTADGAIYYGKYFIYSLFLAPFLAVFGFQGFLVFNMFLLGLMIWMGWRYLRQFNASWLSLLMAVTFYLLSASFVYTFWLTPETFIMFWITTGLFLWLYRREERQHQNHSYRQMLTQERIRRTAWQHAPIAATYSPPEKSQWQRMTAAVAYGYLRSSTFLKWLFVSPGGRLYLAPIPLAIAYAAKITNVLFLLPILIDVFLTEYRTYRNHASKPMLKRVLPIITSLVTIGLIFIIVAQLFVGIQLLLTGQTNQYAGDRRMFLGNFPLNTPRDVWQQGIRHSNEDYWRTSFFLTPKTLLYNIYYYLFGRFTGMFPYFICSFLALYFFVRVVFLKHASPIETQEKWRRFALLFAIVAHIGAYILIAPINYHGGSGAFGNRFFLNIYPAFLFLITTVSPQRKERSFPLPLLLTWLIGSLFLGQALINPFQTSYYPAAPAFKFPYRFFPVELTMINAIPTHVNPHLMQSFNHEEPQYRRYFFDENAWDFNRPEFWVKGERTTEFALVTSPLQSHVVVTLRNGPIPNTVKVTVTGQTRTITLTAPGETHRLVFPLTWWMPYFESFVYPVKIHSSSGFVPKFHQGTQSNYLGCSVSLSFDALDAANAYLEQGQLDEAISLLEPTVDQQPDNVDLRLTLGEAYLQHGRPDAALQMLEHAEAHVPERFTAITVYEAEDLFRHTGDIRDVSDASNGAVVEFEPKDDEPGFLVYGPYEEFPAGSYLATFRVRVEPHQDESAFPIGTALFLDVYSQKYSTPLVRQTISAEIPEKPAIQDFREYTLPFTLDHPASLEFRVETTGYAHVLVDKINIQSQLPARLHQALASVYLQQDNYEAAYGYLTKALKDDVDNSILHMKFLTTLLALERWEEAHQFLMEHGFLSNYHTGLITYLDPQRVGNTLPESLQQIYATNMTAFVPEYPVEAQFSDKLALLGYDLQGERIAPGGEISVSYYWKALEAMDEDYVIFVHFIRREHSMLDPETVTRLKRKFGRPITGWFQQDHEPLSGAYPTSQWIPGELVREDYTVAIPPGIEPGEYEIWLGVWNPLTETRLSTAHEKNKVHIGTFWIDE